MKYFLSAVMAAGWLCLAMAAFAQSTTPSAQPSPAPAAAPASPSSGSPTGGGKRGDRLIAAQGKKGQERQDEMQLCMAQGHLDCLKQAIDQKVVGEPRKNFIKSCVGGDGPEPQ
jgi:hypothetical protein